MPYKDPEKEKERNRRRWRENKEVMRQRNKEYYENNKEKIAETYKKWKDNNKDKIAANNKRYQQTQKGRFVAYSSHAKARGIDFKLSFDEFIIYWQNRCHYCGDTIETIGLDRLDSSIGYELENVVSCCGDCNYMKLQKSKAVFIEYCRKILIHQGFTVKEGI
ncbi:hypothetical protein KAR91_39705 [Candidatus Pacearchaeota archaeon]|nr:hypothetical protein [Candidatus Pacearchaeota archaeon]